MSQVLDDKELIGLKFKKEEGFIHCLEVLEKERPDIYFSLPGMQSIIIQEKELEWFKQKLDEKKVDYETVGVISAGDVPPEELDELRSEYLRDYGANINRGGQRKRIEELKNILGLP